MAASRACAACNAAAVVVRLASSRSCLAPSASSRVASALTTGSLAASATDAAAEPAGAWGFAAAGDAVLASSTATRVCSAVISACNRATGSDGSPVMADRGAGGGVAAPSPGFAATVPWSGAVAVSAMKSLVPCQSCHRRSAGARTR